MNKPVNHLPNGQYAAPVLKTKGDKTQNNDTNQSYIIPQKLMDILFSKLGTKNAQLRIMLVLCGTKPGFFVSEAWMLERTNLLHQSYLRARKELEEMGWLICKPYKEIIVNYDAIYNSVEPQQEVTK